jgi:IS30 family transposase
MTMTYKNYTHISYKERVLIEQFKEKDNLSIAEIARKLNRNKSTILRELRRGATKYVRKFSLIVTRVQLLV